MNNQALKDYLYGMKKAIPVFFGFLPVAITFAIMAMGSSMTAAQTVSMSVMVFAGASQIMAAGMLAEGAGAISIIVATFVLNLRHIIMSTCVFKKMKPKGAMRKLASSFGVTDESFAIFTTEDDSRCTQSFLFGVITVTYSSWIFGTAVGIFASGFLPKILADSFAIALYALFIALIVPDIKKSLRLLAVVVITALLNLALGIVIPSSWAIILSTLAGALIGVFIVEDKNSEKGGEAV